jgi:enoyl-CoA hydratase/carnithine racemase
MDEPLLLREDRDGIARLTLNRPKQRNALSRALMAALHEALDAVEADRSVRVAVLAGAGPGFCAGHDLRELQALGREGHAAVFAQCSALMQRIVSLRVPVIARVHGIATAAGCQLVATCDLALAGRSARFATPGVNIGLFCSTPMVALSRAVGRKAAMEMLLTGEMIDAETAERLGLVNHAIEDEALDAAVDALAARIASRSPASVAYGKPAFYRQAEMPLASAYEFAAEVMVRNMQATDAAEGIGAFIEKREPVWVES